MIDRNLLDRIAERVDQLVTLDIRGRGQKCPVRDVLYPAAREPLGRPISAAAAERIAAAVKRDDRIMFVTGMACYGMAPETDGPPGAVALARAIQIGLKGNPIFVIHENFTGMLERTAYGGGFLPVKPESCLEAWRKLPSAGVVEGFPVDDAAAVDRAEELMERYSPAVMIAVEARGPNKQGVYHVVDGSDVTSREAKLGRLFQAALKRGILTIGILDGCGHEIGFGAIADAAKKTLSRYGTCGCGCESGMSDSTNVDIAFPAATSNWGAYAIETCLAALLNNPELIHDEETERRTIALCADAGGMDGLSGRPEYSVDGLPAFIQTALISMLRQIVVQHLKGYSPGIK